MSASTRGRHPSPEELDALLDPLDASADRRVEDHVGRCGECRDLLDGMRRVRRLLHEEGLRPVSMPPMLQARLESSLRAMPATEAPAGTQAVRTADGLPGPAAQPGASVPRWLGLAAGLVVLAGTGLAASQLLGPGGDNAVSSSAAGASSSTATARSGPLVERSGEAGSVPTAAPTTWGPVALPPRGVTATGTAYTERALPTQVRLLLSATPLAAPERSGSGRSGPERFGPEPKTADGAGDETETAWLADPNALGRCVAALGAPGRQPLAVDVGSWEGRPAGVVVVPDASNRALAAVVEPPCNSATDVLYRTRVQR